MATARNAKAKGRLGQQAIRDKLLEAFPQLEKDDIRSTAMGQSGEDLQLSPAARKLIPISAEVKRRKSFKTVYDFLNQAKQDGSYEPVVFFRADRQDWLVFCNLDHYIDLLKGCKNED